MQDRLKDLYVDLFVEAGVEPSWSIVNVMAGGKYMRSHAMVQSSYTSYMEEVSHKD